MRLGISLRSGHPVADVRLGARWMVERARAAAAAGLDSLFVGDHHIVAAPYYQNSPILGRLLAEWPDRPCGALYLLPLWHPVLVAEQVGTLAAIAGGRFILQCAIGAGREQFAGMGVPLRERVPRFEASLGIIRRLLRGETVDADTPVPIRGARIAPIPPEPVEVWIGGHAPAAIDRAARLGDGWLAGPDLLPARAAALAARYRERCAAHGRTPTAVAIRRDVYVGRDDAEAEAVAGPVLAAGYRGFDPAATVYGSVERVAEAFRELAAAGYTDVIVRNLAPEQAQALASIERLAEVRQHIADA